MVKIGCLQLGEYTHEEHTCTKCAYYGIPETGEPCIKCLKTTMCHWMPAL